MLRTAGLLVALTWLPGLVGDALGLGALSSWGTTSGYVGLSWLVPACFVAFATGRAVRRLGLGLHWQTVTGLLAGLAAGVVLLVGAAQVIGG
jgi:hypothetical protein